MHRFLHIFVQALLAVLVIGKVRCEEDVDRPPSVAKVWVEIVDAPLEAEEEIDILREDSYPEAARRDDNARSLQQFLPYCEGIHTEILCTNMRTNKDCVADIVPYNKNGCYLYLKYTIRTTNTGSKDAKIVGLKRLLNGEERNFSGVVNKGFILKPRMRISISLTEYIDYCDAHNFIGAGAEVLASVGDQATHMCVEHDVYYISGVQH